jgi:2,3-bisphosphoglycerate-dependent phosphoglycerate mutase
MVCMTLLLIRHGETAGNAARVLQLEDTPLNAVGRRQAAALAGRIADLAPAALVSSDLPRAWATAQAIAAATGLPVVAMPSLRERDFGALRGQRYDDLGFDPLTMTSAPPDGESAAGFERRVALAFDELLRRCAEAGGALAVVTHGLVLRTLVARHARPREPSDRPPLLANASLTIVDASPPHAVMLFGCTRHLDAAAQGTIGSLRGG